jgi:hypothetical protein
MRLEAIESALCKNIVEAYNIPGTETSTTFFPAHSLFASYTCGYKYCKPLNSTRETNCLTRVQLVASRSVIGAQLRDNLVSINPLHGGGISRDVGKKSQLG